MHTLFSDPNEYNFCLMLVFLKNGTQHLYDKIQFKKTKTNAGE